VITPAFNKLFGADGASASVSSIFQAAASQAQQILNAAQKG
jgi:hypothetical protein